MNQDQLQQLATRLNLNFALLEKIRTRFKPKDETELIRLSNEIRDIQNQTQADDDSAIEFLASKTTDSKPGQAPTKPQNRQVAQETTNEPQQTPQQAQLEQSTQQPAQQTPNQPAQTPQKPSSGVPQFKYDVNNRRQVPGASEFQNSNSIMDAMFGEKSFITQSYANYAPDLEPNQGYNWGTDFRPANRESALGKDMKNPFKADLEVIKVVDGFGEGGKGRFDQNTGYGNQVIVKRSDTGEIMKLSHVQQGIGYKEGDRIAPGATIAKLGNSGNVTGPHVDIEVFDPDGSVKDFAELQPIDEQTPNVSYNQEGKETYKKQDYKPQQSQEPIINQEVGKVEPIKPVSEVQVPEELSNRILSTLPENQRQAAAQALPQIAGALQQEGILTPRTLGFAVATAGAESSFDPTKREIMAQRGINPRNDYIASLQENYSGGKDYAGRGYIQLTHDTNYKKYGDRIGVDLVNNPELAADPLVSTKILAAYLKDSGAADLAEKGDYQNARVRVQGQGALNDQFIGKTKEIASLSDRIANSVGNEDLQKIAEKATPKEQKQAEKSLQEQVEPATGQLAALDQGKETSKSLLDVFSENLPSLTGQAYTPEQQEASQSLPENQQYFSGAVQKAQEQKNILQQAVQDPLGLGKQLMGQADRVNNIAQALQTRQNQSQAAQQVQQSQQAQRPPIASQRAQANRTPAPQARQQTASQSAQAQSRPATQSAKTQQKAAPSITKQAATQMGKAIAAFKSPAASAAASVAKPMARQVASSVASRVAGKVSEKAGQAKQAASNFASKVKKFFGRGGGYDPSAMDGKARKIKQALKRR